MLLPPDFKMYKAPFWMLGGHSQTIWPAMLSKDALSYQRERLELPDGDFLDLDWYLPERMDQDVIKKETQKPIVMAIPGLEGSAQSRYIGALLERVRELGWCGIALNHRGLSGEHNRLPLQYHSGWTKDLAHVIHVIGQRTKSPLFLVGYSLGGNQTLKWLGEPSETDAQARQLVTAAVAVSVPFDLSAVTRCMNRGLSRIYQDKLLKSLKRRTAAKMRMMSYPLKVSADEVLGFKTFYAFDDAVTAPLYGFKDAEDYYRKSSCIHYLKAIETPVYIIHALNDPLMHAGIVPDDSQISPAIRLLVSKGGGHVGYLSGTPWRLRDWLAEQIVNLLRHYQ